MDNDTVPVCEAIPLAVAAPPLCEAHLLAVTVEHWEPPPLPVAAPALAVGDTVPSGEAEGGAESVAGATEPLPRSVPVAPALAGGEALPLPLPPPLGVSKPLRVPARVAVAAPLPTAVCEGDAEEPPLALSDALLLGEHRAEPLAEEEALAPLADALPAPSEAEACSESVPCALLAAEAVLLAQGSREAVVQGVGPLLTEALPVAPSLAVPRALCVSLLDGTGVRVDASLLEAHGVGEGEPRGEAEGCGEAVGMGVGEGLPLPLALCVAPLPKDEVGVPLPVPPTPVAL